MYNTDKHIEDNYTDLCIFFALHNVNPEDIKQVYVLGHSFGTADIGYFRNIINMTQSITENIEENLSKSEKEYLNHIDPIEEMHMNIQYAIHGGYRTPGIIPDAYPPIIEGNAETERMLRLEAAVVHRRFLIEQQERNMQTTQMFFKKLRRIRRKITGNKSHSFILCNNEEKAYAVPKKSSPQWHISYFSDEDKQRIESMMRQLKCQNFTLYPTIDSCLEKFRLS